MNYSSQLKLNKIKKYLSGAFRFAAEHLFFTFIALIFIAVFFSIVVFYEYGVLPRKAEIDLGIGVIKFKENTYQKILQEWQGRQERFEAAKTREYPDLFR